MRVLKSRVAFHLQAPGFVFIFIFNVSTLFKRDRSSGENDRSDEGLSAINQIDLLYRPLSSVRFSFLIIDAGDHDAVPWKAAVSGVVNACDQSASSKQTPTHTHTHTPMLRWLSRASICSSSPGVHWVFCWVDETSAPCSATARPCRFPRRPLTPSWD